MRKALYGLKQAPRVWFSKIESYFKKEGFEKSNYDHTLFLKRIGRKLLLVCLYVDDLIYTGDDEIMCKCFKLSMQQEFEMTDLRKMKFFLGVEVYQRRNSFVPKKSNPIVPGTFLSKSSSKCVDATLYKLLGSHNNAHAQSR